MKLIDVDNLKPTKGMFLYQTEEADVIISKNSIFPQKAKIDVRFTSDSHETLSFTYNGIQMGVPFEKVWELIEETRKDNRVS